MVLPERQQVKSSREVEHCSKKTSTIVRQITSWKCITHGVDRTFSSEGGGGGSFMKDVSKMHYVLRRVVRRQTIIKKPLLYIEGNKRKEREREKDKKKTKIAYRVSFSKLQVNFKPSP